MHHVIIIPDYLQNVKSFTMFKDFVVDKKRTRTCGPRIRTRTRT